jgi:hypothetical protein
MFLRYENGKKVLLYFYLLLEEIFYGNLPSTLVSTHMDRYSFRRNNHRILIENTYYNIYI